MEGRKIEWVVFDELSHLDREYYKALHYKQLYGYSQMELDRDLSRRQAMDRIHVQIIAYDERIAIAERERYGNIVVNRLKNEQRELIAQWDNLKRQEPKQWKPVEERPQQEQTQKCVIYYIGGPWDMVKKVEEKKPLDAKFVDVVEHAKFWDGKEDVPRIQKACYHLTELETFAPICDGLPVFAAVYKGIEE